MQMSQPENIEKIIW